MVDVAVRDLIALLDEAAKMEDLLGERRAEFVTPGRRVDADVCAALAAAVHFGRAAGLRHAQRLVAGKACCGS
jgi:hypothetical protein